MAKSLRRSWILNIQMMNQFLVLTLLCFTTSSGEGWNYKYIWRPIPSIPDDAALQTLLPFPTIKPISPSGLEGEEIRAEESPESKTMPVESELFGGISDSTDSFGKFGEEQKISVGEMGEKKLVVGAQEGAKPKGYGGTKGLFGIAQVLIPIQKWQGIAQRKGTVYPDAYKAPLFGRYVMNIIPANPKYPVYVAPIVYPPPPPPPPQYPLIAGVVPTVLPVKEKGFAFPTKSAKTAVYRNPFSLAKGYVAPASMAKSAGIQVPRGNVASFWRAGDKNNYRYTIL